MRRSDSPHLRPWRRLAIFVASALATVLSALSPAPAAAASSELSGWLALGLSDVAAQSSWLGGGFGRLIGGGASRTGSTSHGFAESRLGWRLEASPSWSFFVHGTVRAEPGSRAAKAGLVEAFAQWQRAVGQTTEVRARLGTFFLPTSRENVDPLWSSRYTLTLSALNSWIGEEIRPSGLDVAMQFGEHTNVGVTVFGGNDTAGALLAWRGFSFGERVTVLGEALPLPPLASLRDPLAFAAQRRDGTRPREGSLDGRLGWDARARWQAGGLLLQSSAYDNRGDRRLHQGEYAWRTATQQLAAQVDHDGWTVIAEGLRGNSGMGPLARAHVDIDFRAGYLLVSRELGAWRASARYDRFAVDDLDGSAERNDERGWGVALALFWQPSQHWRLGGEALRVRGRRPAAADSGVDAETGGDSLRLELRAAF